MMLKYHFDMICNDIWNRIKISLQLGINQGEETISDNLLLYLAQQKLPDIRIKQTPKNKESVQGTDWEWWIGNHSGWLRYAVQAKKLNSKKNCYKSLKHSIGNSLNKAYQHDILEKYAHANNAIPLYAFYNYIEKDSYTNFWKCCLPLEESKLGSTVTPLKNVQTAIAIRGRRTFDKIHEFQETIPLRCLVTCPKIPKIYLTGEKYDSDSVSELLKLEAIEDYKQLPEHFYNHEVKIYPKKIVFFEIEK